jgi:D-galactarolactone cycloisomerase
MKITAIEPIFVALPYDHGAPKPMQGTGVRETLDILFVRVETDEGITGWGEAFSNASALVTLSAVRDVIARLAIGKDPTDIGGLMTDLARRMQTIMLNGPIGFAMSGLDLALWDIAGKRAGAPVWKLLGGKGKARIPAYASLMRLATDEHITRVTRMAIDRGYRDIKLHEHDVPAVASARKAIGPDTTLTVDTNCYWNSEAEIIDFAARIAPYDIAWLEEPLFPADQYDGLARVRQAISMPLAAGECLGNFNDFRWMTAAGSVDVAQPSIAKMGGITQMLRVFDHIEGQGGRVVPHSPYVGPALIATLHVLAARDAEIVCEHRNCDLAASPLGDWVVARDGYLRVPDAPGLGLELDMKVMERFRVA